jgi:hypothetical protein
LEKEKGILEKEKCLLKNEKVKNFGTKFESYNVFYYRTEGVYVYLSVYLSIYLYTNMPTNLDNYVTKLPIYSLHPQKYATIGFVQVRLILHFDQVYSE